MANTFAEKLKLKQLKNIIHVTDVNAILNKSRSVETMLCRQIFFKTIVFIGEQNHRELIIDQL